MDVAPLETAPDGVRLRVRLTARGGRDALEGVETLADGRAVLKARVRAAPEKGGANAALEALVARTIHVPKSAVSVTGGVTNRLKTLHIIGDPESLSEAVRAVLSE